MIVIVHNNIEIVNLYSTNNEQVINYKPEGSIAKSVFDLAKLYPNELIIWVYNAYEEFLNTKEILSVFHHKLIMASFAVNGNYVISKRIGYIEQKPYTNVPRNVSFPTWLMSSNVGGIYAETLNVINNNIKTSSFDYTLCSIAKQLMPKGLFCYSEPKLLNYSEQYSPEDDKASVNVLFKFVKQHYKFTWLFNLLLCFVIYESKLPLISFLKRLFEKNQTNKIDLSTIEVLSNKCFKFNKELDVIIPTLGRSECLYNVLQDLAKQTFLPKNIIIIEQNSQLNSVSELEYLKTKSWPFNIKHHFIHQTGACNARNLAIDLVESKWTFLADDDIRLEANFIEKSFKVLEKYKGDIALNILCLQPKEKQTYFITSQTDIFGSGTSILKSSLFKNIKFDLAFENGFGEDSDFGMQIRKQGTDIIFIPNIKILHLKAPIGGFRNKASNVWEGKAIQPKPSPTIMVFLKKHFNEFQLKGYKYVLFVKFYKKQHIKNPYKYLKLMNSKWSSSKKCADTLQLKNEVN